MLLSLIYLITFELTCRVPLCYTLLVLLVPALMVLPFKLLFDSP